MQGASIPISVRQAQIRPDLVVAAMQLPAVQVELCAFPQLHAETLRFVEPESILSLGLSPLLASAEGRFARAAAPRYSRFGPLNFRPAGVPFEARVSEGSFHTIRCRFESSGEWLKAIDFSSLEDAQLEACFDIHAPRIEDSMLRLAEELASPATDSEALVGALVRAIAIDLSRYLAEAGRHVLPAGGGLAARHLRQVFARMEAPGPAPGVDELAQLCGLSRYHFMRAFKQSVGETPAAYARQLLMTRARNLLASTDLSLSDIGKQLGYRSAAAFSAAFKRSCGRSPRAWRALAR